MRAFRSIAVVQFERERVWPVLRDELPDLVPRLADIASVVTESRDALSDGTVLLVNRWMSATRVPDALVDTIGSDCIAWLDRARWSSDGTCRWEIEPNLLSDRIACSGSTSFEPAMAGRGTRVVFEGSFSLRFGNLHALGADLAIASVVEFLASGIIPRNFQQVTRAVAERLRGP